MSEPEHPTVPPRPPPAHVSTADVAGLEAVTRDLRALDYRYGGVVPREAAQARLPAALAMLDLPTPDRLVAPLRTAVADLHNMAAWASFDTGRIDAARRHFATALRLSMEAGNASLSSNIYYRMGRMRLHHGDPAGALAEYRLAELSAVDSGSPLAAALVHANTAWAKAQLGEENAVLPLLAAAQAAFIASHGEPVPGWVAFFTATDLSALTGVVYTELAQRVDPRYTTIATGRLTAAADSFGADMARSRAFTLISLAICHLVDDRVDAAVDVGNQALDLCTTLATTRTVQRLRPLRNEAERHRTHRAARRLAERIRAFHGPHEPPEDEGAPGTQPEPDALLTDGRQAG